MRLLLCLLFLFLPRLALAAEGTAFLAPGLKVELLRNGPAQSDSIPLALAFSLQPGWHIYWKQPGDAGFPPSVTAPKPVTLSPLSFPPPQRLIQDGLKSNILTGDVLLPFTATHVTGNTLKISARWLACATQCVPGHADFTLPLAISVPALGASVPASVPASHPGGSLPLWLLALLGGLILNLMPCVFPVLAMKAVSFARLGGAAHGHIRREALGYGAGVVVSMLALGVLLLGLRAAGHLAFWGFQFHTPIFVALMAWILLTVGLSFAGFFQFSVPQAVRRLPAQNSFTTGLLAVLVAAPCTAPFMGVAVAAALTMKMLPALGLFAMLGLGMALPILALGFVPHLASALPRPGRWMLWVQRALSVPLFASFIWLGWVLFRQTGFTGLLLLLLGALVLLVALPRRPLVGFAVLAILPFLHLSPAGQPLTLAGARPYTAQTLETLRAQKQAVFVDLTAAWCITCQVNEHGTLEAKSVQDLFRAQKITLLVGDWTERNPAITALLRRYHHAGVPLYLYYPAGGEALILPQLLTPTLVENEIKEAMSDH